MSRIPRRTFLAVAGAACASIARDTWALTGAPALVGLSRKTDRVIAGGYVDDGSARGHAIRDGRATPTRAAPRERRRVQVAIVGAGIGGLTAGWRLDALGMRDWLLLELADAPGGNARSGANAVSAYPWGAHYLPLPSRDATYVRQLMRELGVLSADGEWDERVMAHDPQERLWQHGRWHEGLEPLDALPRGERAQFVRFQQIIDDWRATGAFTVPTASGQAIHRATARHNAVTALDSITADDWLRQQGFTSPALRWWVEYGTRDDYGASLGAASAWAAVHYFAGRPREDAGPLVWAEGNDWIAQRLARQAGARLIVSAPATRIERSGSRYVVRTPHVDVECDAVIWGAPLFVLPYVLPGVALPVRLEYAPWVVANLTIERAPFERGADAAWDNVIYGSPSLGYVDATHQRLAQHTGRRVWTWYHAVVDRPADDGRRWLAARPWSAWRDDILADLARAHPDIRECVSRIDVVRWGHAMARPTPGVLSRVERLNAWQPAPRVFIAHADMSGLSLFEEAQWHGVHAAHRAARVVSGG